MKQFTTINLMTSVVLLEIHWNNYRKNKLKPLTKDVVSQVNLLMTFMSLKDLILKTGLTVNKESSIVCDTALERTVKVGRRGSQR